MRKGLSLSLVFILLATVILSACAAPTPQVVVKEVVKEVPKEVVREVVKEVPKEVVKEVPKEVVVTKQVEVEKARPKMKFWIDHPFLVKSTEGLLKSYVLDWAQQKGVDLEYSQDSDKVMFPRIDAAIENKSLPDVILLNISWMPKLRKAGQTIDLSDLVKELGANMEGFTAGAAASVVVNGKSDAVPFLASSEMQYVRKDLLDAKGLAVPDTWEEVYKAATAVNNPPKVWGWGTQVAAAAYDCERHRTAMIWAYGGSIFGKDGKTITLDSPATRTVLDMLKDAYDKNIIPKDAVSGDDTWNNKVYQSGTVAFIENTGSVATWLKTNDKALFDNSVFKAFPAGPSGRFVQGDVWVLFVPSTSKYQEQAKDLIRYISQPKLAEELIVAMGGFRVPVYKGLSKLPMWEDRSLKPLADAVPYTYMAGYPGPVTATALEVFKQLTIAKMVTRVLVDKWSNDKAIAEAVATIQRIQKEQE